MSAENVKTRIANLESGKKQVIEITKEDKSETLKALITLHILTLDLLEDVRSNIGGLDFEQELDMVLIALKNDAIDLVHFM